LEGVQRAREDSEGPLPIESEVGRGEFGVGGERGFAVVEREVIGGGAAFEAMSGLKVTAEEVFESAEQIGPEFSMLGGGSVEAAPLEEFGEEGVGEVAGLLGVVEAAAEESEDGLVVGGAEFTEGSLSVFGSGVGLADLSPAGALEERIERG
jgi:hypothetical protein